MSLASIADRLSRHRWTGAEVSSMMGPVRACWVAHAASPGIRDDAASGGAVSALLVNALEAGGIDAALVCVTSVEDGRVRARYQLARSRDEILAARGSTYVLGDFAREAIGLLEGFDGRVAVVGLPCEISLVSRKKALADKIAFTVALFCGHTTEPRFLDRVLDRLGHDLGARTLTGFRFRRGHWRGRLTATFDDGSVIERPSAFYLLYHNLYYGTPKKCLFCGDHFGFAADISVGDIWSQKYKSDPIKHSAVIAKTDTGVRAADAALERGVLAGQPAPVTEALDGQRRTAPFHFNVTARSRAAARFGVKIPDKSRSHVRWHDLAVARMTVANHLATRTDEGIERVLSTNRRLLKARLYWMKGLESLPTGPLVSAPPADAPRFSLIAVTVSGNRGAEAMLATAVGRLRERYPDARFSVYSYYPKKDRALISDPTVTVHSSTPAYLVGVLFPLSILAAPIARLTGKVPRVFPASVRDMGASRALIDLAGVSFIDGREKFLPFNILTILPAMLLKTPVFKLAQAMGPFRNPVNRTAARILRRCALVVPRGDVTLEHMEQIDFPASRMLPAADVAFLFRDEDSLSVEGDGEARALAARATSLLEQGHRVVGVCPSAVIAGKAEKEGWDYVGFMARFVTSLLEDGHAVLLFPNATRAGSTKLRNNDLPVIAAIAEQAGTDAHLLAVTGDMNAAALRVVLRACSCAAVSRFHAMVGALSEGVPVAVVGWSHKYLEVMEQFGLGEFVFDYSAHDPQMLREVVNHLIEQRLQHAETIARRLPEVRAQSFAQFERLFSEL